MPNEPHLNPLDAHKRDLERRRDEIATALALLGQAIARQPRAGHSNPDQPLTHTLETPPATAESARGSLTIREARPADVEMFVALMTVAVPEAEPETLWDVRRLIENEGRSLSQHGELALVAVHAGRIIGALLAHTPMWLLKQSSIAPRYVVPLARRIMTIQGLAVRPEHRLTGVGRALVHRAENDLRAAGWELSTLLHGPELDVYYAKLGYSSHSHLALCLPGRLARGSLKSGTRIAVKPLVPSVKAVPVVGLPSPVITGLLPGTELPANAWFDPHTKGVYA